MERVVSLIPEALEHEVHSALDRAAIYEVDSYGWLNADDADPEFVGHAMWQTRPTDIDTHYAFGGAPVAHRPGEIEKLVLTAGDDFYGIMQLSRLSIGLALVWHEARQARSLASRFFDLYHTDALLKLAIASDRVRELLVLSCAGVSSDVYGAKTKRNRFYVTPFHEAGSLLGDRGISDPRLDQPLATLPNLGDEIFLFVKQRNAIVHEISTRVALVTRDGLTSLQERFDQEQATGFVPRSGDWSWEAANVVSQERSDREQAVAGLRRWYELLIQTSNSVFQVEYWSRMALP